MIGKGGTMESGGKDIRFDGRETKNPNLAPRMRGELGLRGGRETWNITTISAEALRKNCLRWLHAEKAMLKGEKGRGGVGRCPSFGGKREDNTSPGERARAGKEERGEEALSGAKN